MTKREELVRGYANALVAAASAEGDLAVLEDALFSFAKAYERQSKVRDALVDPALPIDRKRGLIRDLLGDRAHGRAASMIAFVVEQGRARELPAILEAFAEASAASRDEVLAEVRTAVPLAKAQRDRLVTALGKATGRSVDVKVVVDPTVVGGVVARVGDEVFDGSVRARLDEVRERMAGR